MRVRLVALVCVVVLALGGAGTALALLLDGGPDYCGSLQANQSIFADDGTGLQLITNLPQLEKLADQAPDDLSDEWQTFTTALEQLRAALRAAGVAPGAFVDGRPPAGLSAEQRATIVRAADAVSSADVVSAAGGIDQQARDVCKLQLGL